MNESTPQTQAKPARPAVVTEDGELLDQILRLCAAASVTPDLADDVTRRREAWTRASLVLVGDDQASAMTNLGLNRRDNVVLVSQLVDPAPLWRLAVDLRADHVVVLPQDQQQLIDRLSDQADGDTQARTLGVVGGCGGAGASTLAGGLALTAARSGRQALLVDADALGGGLELLLGYEDVPGLRWPDVAATEGRVSASAFRSALPSVASLSVLSWNSAGSRHIASGVMHTLVGAGQRGAEVVVIDLPRRPDAAAIEALLRCDAVLLVVPSEVRAVAAARCVLAELRAMCGDIRVVVRELLRSDVSAEAVTGALDLPFVGTVTNHRGLVRAVNDGLGPLGHRGLERAFRRILDAAARP